VKDNSEVVEQATPIESTEPTQSNESGKVQPDNTVTEQVKYVPRFLSYEFDESDFAPTNAPLSERVSAQ
jgi:hypothetical protein